MSVLKVMATKKKAVVVFTTFLYQKLQYKCSIIIIYLVNVMFIELYCMGEANYVLSPFVTQFQADFILHHSCHAQNVIHHPLCC